MRYVERLYAPWSWWLAGAVLVAVLSAAVMAYLPLKLSLVLVAAMAIIIAGLLLVYGSITIRVSDRWLRVGVNTIEARWLGPATALTSQEAQRVSGVEADVHAHLVMRPYVSEAVRITIDDAADPHPHWIVSSRHAEDLASAINSMRENS